ncbi:MAG: hypothetical protein RR315_07290 [Oscillospiraceae bacterium]
MLRRFLATLLCLSLVSLTACTTGGTKPSSEAPKSQASVKTEIVFSDIHKYVEDAVYTMIFEPVATAVNKSAIGMDMPMDIDANWLPETLNTENFNITDTVSKKDYAFAKVFTAPANLEEFYKTTDKDKILDEMQSTYFKVMDMHDGLLKNATEDFGYTLVTDWTGKFETWDFYLLEFIDEEKGIYSIRLATGNDLMNENYYLFEYKADIPVKQKELIEKYRSIVFSMRAM